jgi:hypothetical protein
MRTFTIGSYVVVIWWWVKEDKRQKKPTNGFGIIVEKK